MFHASTLLTRRYTRVHGVPFANIASATLGKEPPQRLFTNVPGGKHHLSVFASQRGGSWAAGCSGAPLGAALGAAVAAGVALGARAAGGAEGPQAARRREIDARKEDGRILSIRAPR